MYEKHFGLKDRPFRPMPDCSRYYPSTSHEQALEWLLQGLSDQEGIALLTGEPGLGKTLLGHCLWQRVGDTHHGAFLTSSHLPDALSLLQALSFELGLPHEGRTEQTLRLAILEHLLSECSQGHATLLFVDEAQHLGVRALEELRLLANLESGQERALQVVLAGHPTMKQTLESPELGSLRQRLAVRPYLEPLSDAESADYLLHHLRLVTDRPDKVFTAEALELLARGCKGIPRLLGQTAHRALTLACLAGSSSVDAEAALEALGALGLDSDESSSRPEIKRQSA